MKVYLVEITPLAGFIKPAIEPCAFATPEDAQTYGDACFRGELIWREHDGQMIGSIPGTLVANARLIEVEVQE